MNSGVKPRGLKVTAELFNGPKFCESTLKLEPGGYVTDFHGIKKGLLQLQPFDFSVSFSAHTIVPIVSNEFVGICPGVGKDFSRLSKFHLINLTTQMFLDSGELFVF